MRTIPNTLLVVSLLGWSGQPASGQACHDWDADGNVAGWQCAVATDCEDQAWQRNPQAIETCDGLDNDCDGAVDQICDRFCEEVGLFGRFLELTVSGLPYALTGCADVMDDGFLVVSQRLVDPDPPDHTLFYGRAYDRTGTPWAPAVATGEPGIANPYERRCDLAGAGDRALLVWHDVSSRDQETARLMVRVIDSRGRPIGPGPIDLSATSPVGSAPWLFQDPVWDGERFVVFWTPFGLRENLLMSVIHRDGTVPSPTTIVVTDNVDGNSSEVDRTRAVWTGDHFIVVVNDTKGGNEENLNVLKVSRDGVLLSRTGIPDNVDQNFDVVLGDGLAFVVWHRTTAFGSYVRAAFVDVDGNYLDPPGVFPLRTSSDPSDDPIEVHATWSGEMFAAANASLRLETLYVWSWRFWRVLPGGPTLDPGGVLLDEGANLGTLDGLEWNGDDYWIFVAHANPPRFVRERVVCSCQDLDGDQFDACNTLDCDDGDPLIHPLASEVCRGLDDDDCDGLVDCDDTVDCPGGAGPGEVADLRWSGSTLTWSTIPGAQRYDLARGLLSDLRRRSDFLIADCPGLEMVSSPWIDDGRTPPPGEVLWYLVRTEGSPCELGTWGAGQLPRDVTACR